LSRGGEFVRGDNGRSFLIARKFPHKFYPLVRLEIDRRSSLETQCMGWTTNSPQIYIMIIVNSISIQVWNFYHLYVQ